MIVINILIKELSAYLFITYYFLIIFRIIMGNGQLVLEAYNIKCIRQNSKRENVEQ